MKRTVEVHALDQLPFQIELEQDENLDVDKEITIDGVTYVIVEIVFSGASSPVLIYVTRINQE